MKSAISSLAAVLWTSNSFMFTILLRVYKQHTFDIILTHYKTVYWRTMPVMSI